MHHSSKGLGKLLTLNTNSQVAVHIPVSAYDRRGQILGGRTTLNRDSVTIFDGSKLLQGITLSTLCRYRLEIVGSWITLSGIFRMLN